LAAPTTQACDPIFQCWRGHEIYDLLSRNLRAQRCGKAEIDEFELPGMMRIGSK
jgi:hypothetical protein